MFKLFKSKHKKHINDPDLGVITFIEKKKNIESHWIVEMENESFDKGFECVVYNDENGISSSQKKLILHIGNKIPELLPRLEEHLNVELKRIDSKAQYLTINQDIGISHIEIWNADDEQTEWEIVFSEKKGFTYFQIGMKNEIPVGLGISA